ncbi:MAG: 3-dehydroquinate synthase [Pseudomonadota bacterium]
MRTLRVDLGERSYPIYIGHDLLSDPDLLVGHIHSSQVVLVSNVTIAPLYLDKVSTALESSKQVTKILLPDGEQFKTMATLSEIYDQVMAAGHNRTTTFVALGGGVVGDVTGFAAATYQRGVRFVQLPTTLLAQVDSSVGGKTAVNHPLGKNMIGAFHQPDAVLIDTSTLQTLPAREFSAGLAEVIKYGLIRDEPFYRWLQHHMPQLIAREQSVLAEAIERSCGNKASVVSADERESGMRAILNLGHTFGHAIETELGYSQWLHGEAVAAGMVLALELASRRGWIEGEEVSALRSLLEQAELPVTPPADMTAERFLELMARDKKVIDGQLRLVLPQEIGRACVVDDVTDSELTQLLNGSA